jgi:hypothetical protein
MILPMFIYVLNWSNKFIIHDDLKTELQGQEFLSGFQLSHFSDSHSDISYCSKQALWHFYEPLLRLVFHSHNRGVQIKHSANAFAQFKQIFSVFKPGFHIDR